MLAAVISAASAYDESLSDCETFANQFNGTCGNSNSANVYPDYVDGFTGWGTGTDIECAIRGTADSDDPSDVQCNSGGGVTPCTVNRKNCVTCRQASTQVYIRYQSNGMPNHCFGTLKSDPNVPTKVSYYPET